MYLKYWTFYWYQFCDMTCKDLVMYEPLFYKSWSCMDIVFANFHNFFFRLWYSFTETKLKTENFKHSSLVSARIGYVPDSSSSRPLLWTICVSGQLKLWKKRMFTSCKHWSTLCLQTLVYFVEVLVSQTIDLFCWLFLQDASMANKERSQRGFRSPNSLIIVELTLKMYSCCVGL